MIFLICYVFDDTVMRDEKVFGPVSLKLSRLPRLMDRDFLYIYSSLKVKNLYKFLIGSTTYWKIQYFFVWHCLPVCWSVGCAVRYIGVRRVYWS